jgi:hypothetical protein
MQDVHNYISSFIPWKDYHRRCYVDVLIQLHFMCMSTRRYLNEDARARCERLGHEHNRQGLMELARHGEAWHGTDGIR